MCEEDDRRYMRRCVQLAQLGRYYVSPNPMVGAVLVRVGHDMSGVERQEVVGEGWHRVFGGPHAEVNCICDAERRGVCDFSDCTLYVSLEPCSHYGKTPPCANMLVAKGIRRVVIGMGDPNVCVRGRGIAILQCAGVEVKVGVEEELCRELNKRFICLHTKHRPYVVLKWAESADGYLDKKRSIENRGDGPEVLSDELTKRLVHKMRAENRAIMVGTNTALLDNPRLGNTRWVGRQPVRVLLDRKGVVPRDSRIFEGEAETIVYEENTDFGYILKDLCNRGIDSLMVEGGATLFAHIIEKGIWDEAHQEVTAKYLGSGVSAPILKGEKTLLLEERGHKLYKIVPNNLVK